MTPKEAGQPSTCGLPEKWERERGRAFIVLPYFQHTSIFQNTNVLPQNTAELQHPAGCIIDEESGVQFTRCHPEPLLPSLSLERPRSLPQVAVPCGSSEGPLDELPQERCEPSTLDLPLPCTAPLNPSISPPSENAGPGRPPRMGTTQTEGSWGQFFPVLSFIFCRFLCPPNLQPVGAGGQRSVCSDPATDQAVSLATVLKPVSLGAGGRLCSRNSQTPHPATPETSERRLRVKPRPPRLPGGPPTPAPRCWRHCQGPKGGGMGARIQMPQKLGWG